MPTKTKSSNLDAMWTQDLQVGEYKSLSPELKRVGQNPISKGLFGISAWNMQTFSQKKGMTRLQQKKAKLGLSNISSPCKITFKLY